MEEKVIIKGELNNIKTTRNTVWGVGLIPALIMFVYTIITYLGYLEKGFNKEWMVSTIVTYIILIILFAVAAIAAGFITYACLSKIELVVTDKRVYGCTAFGKRVDIPNDSISAIGVCMFRGITVASSSGKIQFYEIKNRDEIQKVISSILVERQGKGTTTIKQEIPQSNADELRKFKELLDSGIISQEEFEAKKKQLLGV